MRFLHWGDIVGRQAREAVIAAVPRLRRELALDFVIANGENAAHGFGITDAICQSLYAGGVDVITTGNHVWDRREIMTYIAGDPRLLRPINFPAGTPGNGFGVFDLPDGRKIMVVNAMARLFMDALDDPFAAVERVLAAHRILAGGTAYMTDVGMCGDYDSVIGMQKEPAIARFVRKLPGERLEVSPGEPTICAALVETDDATGLARAIWPLRMGGKLDPVLPPAALESVVSPAV